jgi:hypothetical protein
VTLSVSGKEGAHAAQGASGVPVLSSSSAAKRAPPPPPPASLAGSVAAAAVSASQGLRAHAVALGSPHNSPAASRPGSNPDSEARLNGNPFVAPQHQTEQQAQPGGLSQLQDIKVRAAALAASKEQAGVAAAGRDSGGSVERAQLVERQPQPYSMASNGASGGGSSSARGRVPDQASLQAPQAGGSGSPSRAAGAAGAQRAPGAAAGCCGSGSVSEAAGVSAVLSELLALRAQVSSLSEQNQAFIFRIKQLEEYATTQSSAMARLTQQVERLQQQQQQQQQGARPEPAAAAESGGWFQRHTPRRSNTDSGGASQR